MLLFTLLACLDHDQAPGSEGAFVAMQADFSGYTGWDSVTVGGEVDGHDGTERTVYVSEAPEEGADAFAVGTMIVKVTTGGDIHAMAKRGGGFNATGAVGWEWFELVTATDGTPIIAWRGAAPPDGEGYGDLTGGSATDTADPQGDCNGCHSAAYANDYVHTVPL